MVKHLDAALVGIWTLNDRKVALELRASATTSKLPKGGQIGQAIAGRIAQERKLYRTNAVSGELSARDQDWARREGVSGICRVSVDRRGPAGGRSWDFHPRGIARSDDRDARAVADWVADGIQGKWAEAILRESEAPFPPTGRKHQRSLLDDRPGQKRNPLRQSRL